MFKYDRAKLIGMISKLSNRDQAAFAASCAQPLLPWWEAYCRHAKLLAPQVLGAPRDGLAQIWQYARFEADLDAEKLNVLIAAIDKNTPSDSEPDSALSPYVEDAASSAIYAIQCALTGDPQLALYCSNRLYSVYDDIIIHRNEDAYTNEVNELEVLADPLIQNELSRQYRDLELLHNVHGSTNTRASAIDQIYEMSLREEQSMRDVARVI